MTTPQMFQPVIETCITWQASQGCGNTQLPAIVREITHAPPERAGNQAWAAEKWGKGLFSCLSEVCLLFSVYFFWIPWPKIRLFSFGSKQLLQCLYQHSESALITSELLRVWRLTNARKVLKNRKHKTCTLCSILNPQPLDEKLDSFWDYPTGIFLCF